MRPAPPAATAVFRKKVLRLQAGPEDAGLSSLDFSSTRFRLSCSIARKQKGVYRADSSDAIDAFVWGRTVIGPLVNLARL